MIQRSSPVIVSPPVRRTANQATSTTTTDVGRDQEANDLVMPPTTATELGLGRRAEPQCVVERLHRLPKMPTLRGPPLIRSLRGPSLFRTTPNGVTNRAGSLVRRTRRSVMISEPAARRRPGPVLMERFSIVCLSSQEWDLPLPTNRQQIMARAAARGHDVLFVETGDFVGKHLLRLLRGPDRRGLARRLLARAGTGPGIRIGKLLNVVPLAQRFRLANRVNWAAGGFLLRRAARRLPDPVVLWIYDPRGADAIGSFGERFAVYDCVDDYAQQAGGSARSRTLVAALDAEAAARARLVFATTPGLLEPHTRPQRQRPSRAERGRLRALPQGRGPEPGARRPARAPAAGDRLRGQPGRDQGRLRPARVARERVPVRGRSCSPALPTAPREPGSSA